MLIEDAELQTELKQVKNQLRGESCGYQTLKLPPHVL